LETLAIIAYRQPCVRSEIEAVRGVAVDQILRNLLELQLVRIVGRSELPGRPMLYGTTQKFLEYFGINDLNDLPGVEELKGLEGSKAEKGTQAAAEEDVEDDDEVRDSEDEGEPDEDESAEDADGEDAS
jgi:segregation and condensation protein B